LPKPRFAPHHLPPRRYAYYTPYTPYTLHPTPYTLHPEPYNFLTPYTLHLTARGCEGGANSCSVFPNSLLQLVSYACTWSQLLCIHVQPTPRPYARHSATSTLTSEALSVPVCAYACMCILIYMHEHVYEVLHMHFPPLPPRPSHPLSLSLTLAAPSDNKTINIQLRNARAGKQTPMARFSGCLPPTPPPPPSTHPGSRTLTQTSKRMTHARSREEDAQHASLR